MNRAQSIVVALGLSTFALAALPGDARTTSTTDVARGAVLVRFGGCNDCHTPGWRESDATVPTSAWMTGSIVGFRGPWGTVYPANVRREFQSIDEGQWLAMIRTRGGHPPMTWHNLRGLSVPDQRAIYRFIHALGGAGKPAHLDVPHGVDPDTPFYDVTPSTPPPR